MRDAPDVRRLTHTDVDAVSALARTVWQATYPPLISQAQIDRMLADRYAPERIGAQLDDPDQAWWVARTGQAIVGVSHALKDGTDCKLDKLYVDPARQRQGVGEALMRAVSDWARQQRARRVWLQVNRGNAGAIAAYEKYGFRIVASCVFDIGDGFVMDDHVMARALPFAHPDDAVVRGLLENARTIAVVGLSPQPARPSHRVAHAMQRYGYRIVPVRPLVDTVLGEQAYANLAEIPFAVDLVNVFRAAEHVPAIVEQCLALHSLHRPFSTVHHSPAAIWLQEGIVHDAAAQDARTAGMTVVMDRCILKEYVRLFTT